MVIDYFWHVFHLFYFFRITFVFVVNNIRQNIYTDNILVALYKYFMSIHIKTWDQHFELFVFTSKWIFTKIKLLSNTESLYKWILVHLKQLNIMQQILNYKVYFNHLQQYDGENLITYAKFFIHHEYKPCWHDLIHWSVKTISDKQRRQFNNLIINTGLSAYVFHIRHGNNPRGSCNGNNCNCNEDCNELYQISHHSLPECQIHKLLLIRQKLLNITPEDFEKDIDDMIDLNVPFVFSEDSL